MNPEVERAFAIGVPLTVDPVAPYRLVCGSLAVAGGSESGSGVVHDALFFEIGRGDSEGELGRVTFEGLDAIRVSGGESAPYDDGHDFTSWVYDVRPSGWLHERHEYEVRNYSTPLLDSHQHYLFRFHDHFVEAIAAGIWLDQPGTADPFACTAPHPQAPLDAGGPSERGISSGLPWEVRLAATPSAARVRDSGLCSQRLFEFHLTLDGATRETAVGWLRTRHGRTTSRLTRPWTGTLAEFDGVATPADVMPAWELLCSQVAQRRRELGK